MGFTPIKYTLNRNIQSSGLQDQVDGARVIELFSSIVAEVIGEGIAQKVKAST